ncbi:DNA-binding transcriptional ArsR family regulator [Krasilnikovia cinnamomea]|uniref:DNA-binding transcriptional ArsR family regulator n=1 Tax=Krasilnikovia cinnamomea TaxID=349313 RepID=A0A4Q7ZS40_9ACTN|nr:metalloregulator ArsR/SmtB family transcription factor [Krasilnikovia cinnamomea]RZU53325.1 DNA-binding transcriptional ArsR family regulator [Krasilnikovia cinnamomea]
MPDTPILTERTREFLRALASENRQQVLLLFTDGQPRSVGQIAGELGIGQSTASEQLAALRRGGIVQARREGKTVYYCADRDGIIAAMDELQAILRSCCPPT